MEHITIPQEPKLLLWGSRSALYLLEGA